jgi:hypothetical protein
MSQAHSLLRDRRAERPRGERAGMPAGASNYFGLGLSVGFAAAIVFGFFG